MGSVMSNGADSNGPSPDPRAGQPVEPATPVWLAPSVVGTAALREPGPSVVARRQARRDAGLDADGLDYPRARLWVLLVLPAAVVTALCLVALLVSGMVVWGIAGAGAALIAGGATGYLTADRLRMASSERRELVADRSWHSERPWIGPLTQTPERRLVAQAQDAVTRLVSAPAWTSRAFDEHRLRLDLKAELDEIDAQAYQLAASSPGPGANPTPSAEVTAHDSARAALRRRVNALSAYADDVCALAGKSSSADDNTDNAAVSPANEDPLRRAITATVRDEFATDQWTALRRELPVERPDGST